MTESEKKEIPYKRIFKDHPLKETVQAPTKTRPRDPPPSEEDSDS